MMKRFLKFIFLLWFNLINGTQVLIQLTNFFLLLLHHAIRNIFFAFRTCNLSIFSLFIAWFRIASCRTFHDSVRVHYSPLVVLYSILVIHYSSLPIFSSVVPTNYSSSPIRFFFSKSLLSFSNFFFCFFKSFFFSKVSLSRTFFSVTVFLKWQVLIVLFYI